MILRIRKAEVCGPYSLSLTFSNGTQRRVNMLPLLDGPVFEPLRSPEYFSRMALDPVCGTVCWPNGADFAPEALLGLEVEEVTRAATQALPGATPELASDIERFCREIGEPIGVPAEEFIPTEVVDNVRGTYLSRAVQRDESSKREALKALRAGWEDNRDHGQIRRWGRAAANIAAFVLKPSSLDDIDERDEPKAVDAIVRFSGWHHTDNNLWKRFRPYAQRVVEQPWGTIEPI
jgi:Protein of unknown function (DUF2442)